MWKNSQVRSMTPRVARFIVVDVDAIFEEVDDIRGARAIHVCQSNAILVELIVCVEMRAISHGHFCTEEPVPEVWPVANLTIANAGKVHQSVTRKVGEV